MKEGPELVKNLLTRQNEQYDFVEELTSIGYQLSSLSPAKFDISIQGIRRRLKDFVQSEVVLVAREALMNAYKHSSAKQINVDLNFQRGCFGLAVQDDGEGMDSEILKHGN